jgi:hypothetical protein
MTRIERTDGHTQPMFAMRGTLNLSVIHRQSVYYYWECLFLYADLTLRLDADPSIFMWIRNALLRNPTFQAVRIRIPSLKFGKLQND